MKEELYADGMKLPLLNSMQNIQARAEISMLEFIVLETNYSINQ